MCQETYPSSFYVAIGSAGSVIYQSSMIYWKSLRYVSAISVCKWLVLGGQYRFQFEGHQCALKGWTNMVLQVLDLIPLPLCPDTASWHLPRLFWTYGLKIKDGFAGADFAFFDCILAIFASRCFWASWNCCGHFSSTNGCSLGGVARLSAQKPFFSTRRASFLVTFAPFFRSFDDFLMGWVYHNFSLATSEVVVVTPRKKRRVSAWEDLSTHFCCRRKTVSFRGEIERISLQSEDLEVASKESSVDVTGSTIRTLLHGKINPKDWQVFSLGDAGLLQFFRVVSSGYGKPRVSTCIFFCRSVEHISNHTLRKDN